MWKQVEPHDLLPPNPCLAIRKTSETNLINYGAMAVLFPSLGQSAGKTSAQPWQKSGRRMRESFA